MNSKTEKKILISVLVAVGIIACLIPIPTTASSDVPSGPILMYPENGTYTTDHIITFGWYNEEDAQKYFLQVDDNSDFSSPEIETYMVESQFTSESPLPDGTYYWRVKADDNWLWPGSAELTIFTVPEIRASADLGIAAQWQHKDTKMLCLKGCRLTPPAGTQHAWDRDHVRRGDTACGHCDVYCVRAAISMVNSYFGGSLSQDRISYYLFQEWAGNPHGDAGPDAIPENDLLHRGLYPDETSQGLSWALNGAAISNPSGKPTFAQIKAWIDNGQPVLRRNVAGAWHATVIDGYDDAGQLVHVIDPWTRTEGSFSYAALSVDEVWVGPSGATSRSDEASLSQDSDGEGIINFDEINRFSTDPNKADSDCDFVPDKAEVRCYTFLSDDSFDLGDVRNPDPDGDGLRAELDRDSDNGDVIDGAEDLNRNGKVEIGETDPLDDADDSPNTGSTILNGLSWLCTTQNPDGSWQNSVGITSMAALAFLNAGHTEDTPTVNTAIRYILANRNADGSFGWGTYETSLAVLALVATHNPSYNDEIADARDWLVDAQYDEGEGADPTDACYGGWRYGSSPSDGDLSNTQFALMALSAAGLPSGSDTWTKAITFTSRCQNRPASNDQAWAHDNTRPSYNDGGFIYVPGWSLAGGSKSYGSMTAAGIWSLRLCGVGVPDGRVQAGLNWLAINEDCSFDDNPVMGASYKYYYYMSIAKALAMCFEGDLICADWYAALSTKLADLQHDDGYWSHHLDDETTTDFALLALQTRQPPPANLWMSIILASNADICVYDPQGRHACLGDITIPGATFEIDAEGRQIVNLQELEAGKYRIELKGTADGDYSLTIKGYRDDEQTSSETFEGTIEEGEYLKSDVLITSMVGALTIYVEEPEPLLVTDLPNVELISADPTVTSINVTSLNLSEINETYKPEECITPQSAYRVNSTGAGSFTLKFTDIPNANAIIAYKINEANQWIELDMTTTTNTVTITMSVEDPPVVFCSTQHPLWEEINTKLDSLITNVSAADMPNIIKQRLIDKLEYAKALKDNAHEECLAGNFDGATKKLGVAKSQVESFESMVKITRRISAADKASFLAEATEIIGKIDRLIEYIETKHKC